MNEPRAARPIPRTLVQTFPSATLPEALARNRAELARANPAWRLELYDDECIVDYIRRHYGADTLALYERIRPEYGAARADLFRYLRIFAEGGVYLDIKSTAERSLDTIVTDQDEYILCQWANRPGEAKSGHGLHPDLAHVAGGEYQQWHVIARAGHPFLAAVIERALGNLRRYTPWRLGVGAPGVLRTVGPIAYTQAIAPIVDRHPHRLVRDETTLGLHYSLAGSYDHRRHFPRHYSTRTTPVVEQYGVHAVSARLYAVAVVAKRRLKAMRGDR